jgi:tetratricopeptide (TPR) repeat protein
LTFCIGFYKIETIERLIEIKDSLGLKRLDPVQSKRVFSTTKLIGVDRLRMSMLKPCGYNNQTEIRAMETQQQGLKNAPLRGFVQDRFLVDVYKPRNGDEKDIVVLAFLVLERKPAIILSRRITQGQFEFIDVDVSPAPDEKGNYLVFLEIKRSAATFDVLSDILRHIGNMVDIHQWYFQPYAHQEFLDWNRENFLKTISQSPEDHADERSEKPTGNQSEQSGAEKAVESELQEISKQDPQPEHREPEADNQPESDVDHWNAPVNSSISTTANRLHEKEKRHLKRQIDDLKNKMQYLYRQIDFYQEREKMFLRREDQNYNRIRELENLVMSITYSAKDDPEKITRALGPMFNDNHSMDSETDRAAESFFAAEKSEPVEDLAKKYYALGIEAAERKSYQKAVKYFTRFTELNPTAKQGYVKLAVLHYQLKEFEDSRTNALRALKLGSKSAQKILDKIKAKTAAQRAPAPGAVHPPNPANAGQNGSREKHKRPEQSKKTRK